MPTATVTRPTVGLARLRLCLRRMGGSLHWKCRGQRFPIPSGIINASPSNPDSNVNWAQFEPISTSPTYYGKNVISYTESYKFMF